MDNKYIAQHTLFIYGPIRLGYYLSYILIPKLSHSFVILITTTIFKKVDSFSQLKG